MVFNSNEFFLFLFCVVLVYFLLCSISARTSRAPAAWLLLASLFFYGYASPWEHIALFIFLIAANFAATRAMCACARPGLKKALACCGILLNIGFLVYFKYSDFLIATINQLFGWSMPQLSPRFFLGISFISFLQIAYIVDCFRKNPEQPHNFLEYALFVAFFPKLLSGPIALHHEIVPALHDPECRKVNWDNISSGLWLFSIGFFKKIFFGDTFGQWADQGFASANQLTFVPVWILSAVYTLQMYFDFSGYCDMGMGAARMLNINLPINFYAPFQADNIRDFWRRWHMTLGRFIMQYVYYPLGGSRRGRLRTYANLMIIFIVCGIWHGSGWKFVVWGMMHGTAVMIHHLWASLGLRMGRAAGILTTFLFINCSLIVFRAKDIAQAVKLLRMMFTPDAAWQKYSLVFGAGTPVLTGLAWLASGLAAIFFFRDTMQRLETFSPRAANLCTGVLLFVAGYFCMNMERFTPFIYIAF